VTAPVQRTAPPDARCDVTELLVTQCAHCRRTPDQPQPHPARVLGQQWRAAYPGKCLACGAHFAPGDWIGRTAIQGEAGYLGPCCLADTATLGEVARG